MKVAAASIFFPRGGSAQVLRYLTPRLHDLGVDYSLTTGSTSAVSNGDAVAFYGPYVRHTVDYDDAFDAYTRGVDPMLVARPVHPSYEDKHGVPDRSFGRVSPEATAHLEASWSKWFREFGFGSADVAHLNHLTPMQGGLALAYPDLPVVATMHGTEIKFWQSLLAMRNEASTGPGLEYAEFWRDAMAGYAELCDRIIVISSVDMATMTDCFGVDRAKVRHIPHGVDTARFKPIDLTPAADAALWQELLVDDCRAAEVGGPPGSLSYGHADLARLHFDARDESIRLMWLGRFLTQKRLNQLLRAFERLTRQRTEDISLVVWGGFPGEHEGVHPLRLVRELQLEDRVYFVGWRGHDDLAKALPAVDALVVPAVNESFGLMYLEAMASGIPVLATDTGGPLDFVVPTGDDANGWLVRPDDDDALLARLTDIVADPIERRRRGRNALQRAVGDFAWTSVARRYRELFAEVRAPQPARAGRPMGGGDD
ncbi:glycosyltransferase family 4 protein [Nocardia abscessus]|uniref:Glycosyltransferase family 4 protein n=1 Tax=Nocardia abscessus TaxID=120957 RepID=A0ABS0CJ92_9NOCA|nr:glycosyltransferase family 4 protein [Nocardia abscessus]MBF6228508.1 glycosyltransferase family 4 protein [Nocardia abscessus]